MQRFFLLVISGLTLFRLAGQTVQFRNYSIEEGLSQSVVNCVFQDSRGFIWTGTQNGLNRFDGYTFKTYLYNPDDTSSLSNNWIYAIDEDNEGNLYIATKQGLNILKRNEEIFRRIAVGGSADGMVSACVYDVVVSATGTVYMNTLPMFSVYHPDHGTMRHFPTLFPSTGIVEDNRMPLLEDPDGDIWIGSSSGLACFHPTSGSFSYYKLDQPGNAERRQVKVTAIDQDNTGLLWIGTNSGLRTLSKKSGLQRDIFARNPGSLLLGSDFIRAILCDHSGNVWIGTEGNGVHKIQRLDSITYAINSYSVAHGLGHNIVLSLAIDKSWNLWAGTLQGISKTDLKPSRFRLYRRDRTSASVNLLDNVVASIYKAEDGKIWVGNWGRGLNILDRKTGLVEHYSSGHAGKYHLTNDFIHVIFPDEAGNIWLGTRDGIYIFDKRTSSFVRFNTFFPDSKLPDLTNTRIFMITRSRDGNYWIATQQGLFRLSADKRNALIFSAESSRKYRIGSNLVYCVREDHLGYIWIATINGLDVFDPAKEKMTHFRKTGNKNSLCDNFVISLCEDQHGDMWIGTGAFVNKFVRKDSTFLYFDRDDGLSNNNIFEILRDRENTMWFATGGGLSRYDTASGRFRTYGVDDGLQSAEFNLRACYEAPDGEIFFGGMNGFNSFYPGRMGDNPFIPEMVVTLCYTPVQGINVALPVSSEGVLVIDHKSKDFTIEFVALEYTIPERNHYAYMLEGVSSEWIHIGTRRFVSFSGLSPGEYLFRVKGTNNDGQWNETGTTLRIIVLPPWWRSWWAYTAYFLIFAGILMLIIKWRERNLIAERRLLEQKVLERTIQIESKNQEILQKNEALNALNMQLSALNTTKDKFFSIIAHDLRNPFNAIIGLTDIVLQNLPDNLQPGIRKSVNDIREASRHAFDLLQNLLIWARTQTGNIDFKPSLFDLTERVEENLILVQGQAARKNIVLVNHCDTPVLIWADVQMINTILRNLLTNAIKFTPHEGKVEARILKEDHQVVVEICDTGIGITPEIMSKIFRLDSKYTHKGTDMERGTGLGLILCKEFANRHDGDIKVVSEPGRGSCFSVSIPMKNENFIDE